MRACAWTRHGMSAVVKAQLCRADFLLPPYLGPGAETSPGEQGMKITFSILAPKGPPMASFTAVVWSSLPPLLGQPWQHEV